MDEDLTTLILCAAIGFVAQLVDGSLGMAYGVTSNTFLLSIGLPPSLASASVHTAKVFTAAASGLSHLHIGNVETALAKRLLIPGVVGAVLGAYVLTEVESRILGVFVSIYLVIMGLFIVLKALKWTDTHIKPLPLAPLGVTGGFLDAVGGGGWGPVVTTTLMGTGYHPRFAIGSVNLVEFFVALAASITFFIALKEISWPSAVGLILGGVPAAPLAALMSKRMSPQKLMLFVGSLIILLSVRNVLVTLA
ncbi:MAG: hypothetical protein Kow00120_06510 [Anaerolineae bacterium]